MRSELRECLETGPGNFNVKHRGFDGRRRHAAPRGAEVDWERMPRHKVPASQADGVAARLRPPGGRKAGNYARVAGDATP